MIKQTLTILSLVAAATAMANAAEDLLLVSFGINTNNTNTNNSTSFKSSYKNEEKTYNFLFSGASGASTWNNLTDASGNVTNINLSSTTANCGENGRVGTFAGDTFTLYSVFGQNAVTGVENNRGGCNNSPTGTAGTLTFSGLESGQEYSLTLLLGRGNNAYGTEQNAQYSIKNGAEDITAIVLATNQSAATLLPGSDSIVSFNNLGSSSNTANRWGLIEFRFTATDTSIQFGSNSGTAIGALALAKIPEPSMFGLLAGIGALALVGTRRRRKKNG